LTNDGAFGLSPPTVNGLSLYTNTPLESTRKSGATASQIFFFGFNCASGSPKQLYLIKSARASNLETLRTTLDRLASNSLAV
jgi:hypothetical protein